jgi:hypothetical protein
MFFHADGKSGRENRGKTSEKTAKFAISRKNGAGF